MPNQKNQELLKNLKDQVAKATSIVFTDHKGLTAVQANTLRRKMHEVGSEVEVAKNTILKLALKENGHDTKEIEKFFEGFTTTIISYTDPVTSVKKLYEFIKTSSLPKVKLGLFDGKFYSAAQVDELSKLPAKEVLLARLLSALNSPVSGFVNSLAGVPKNFVYALSAIAKSKETK